MPKKHPNYLDTIELVHQKALHEKFPIKQLKDELKEQGLPEQSSQAINLVLAHGHRLGMLNREKRAYNKAFYSKNENWDKERMVEETRKRMVKKRFRLLELRPERMPQHMREARENVE